LINLASENQQLSFSQIASVLKVPETEIESWVVQAVIEGLLEVKIDQLNQLVYIQRCAPRVLTRVQWEQISTRLNNWRETVKQLLESLKTEVSN